MPPSIDSDAVPLDGTPDLTADERKRLRKLLLDDSHATWLRKQARVWVPVLFAVVSGMIAVGSWIAAHWKGTS
jgi:hypothetical protein